MECWSCEKSVSSSLRICSGVAVLSVCRSGAHCPDASTFVLAYWDPFLTVLLRAGRESHRTGGGSGVTFLVFRGESSRAHFLVLSSKFKVSLACFWRRLRARRRVWSRSALSCGSFSVISMDMEKSSVRALAVMAGNWLAMSSYTGCTARSKPNEPSAQPIREPSELQMIDIEFSLRTKHIPSGT